MIVMDSSTPIPIVPDHHRHHHGEPVISGPCLLPSQNLDVTADDFTSTTTAATFAASDQQIHIRVSGTDIRPKEVVLVSLALLLLVFSVALFFKHWRKNYWDINQLPYYAYLYKTDDSLLLAPAPVPPSMDPVPGDEVTVEGGFSPSHSFFGHGQGGGSCQSSLRLDKNGFSRESRSSLRLESKQSSFVCRRHSSSARRAPKRSSFVHVTAEAMQKLNLNRMTRCDSITGGLHHQTSHKRHQTFHSPPWGAVSSMEPKLRRCQSGVDRRSRLHGAGGQAGLAGGHRWTTTRRRYRKSSLNDMSDFESTDTGDDVTRCNVALRELRRRATSTNEDETVAERDDEDELAGNGNDGLLRIIVASPPSHQHNVTDTSQIPDVNVLTILSHTPQNVTTSPQPENIFQIVTTASSHVSQTVTSNTDGDRVSTSSVHTTSSPETRPHFLHVVDEAVI